MKAIRTVLVDDQILFVESLKIVLESRTKDIHVVGIALNGEEAIECVEKEDPQIVLMDVRMPGMGGIEATRIIHERHPEIKVMMLTTFDDDAYVHDAMQYGAVGYVLKNIPPAELIACIRAMRAGTLQISPSVATKLVKQASSAEEAWEVAAAVHDHREKLLEALSRREREVLTLMLKAYENREIAEQLCISEQTVKNHTSAIYSKLEVTSRLQLIRLLEAVQPGKADGGRAAEDGDRRE